MLATIGPKPKPLDSSARRAGRVAGYLPCGSERWVGPLERGGHVGEVALSSTCRESSDGESEKATALTAAALTAAASARESEGLGLERLQRRGRSDEVRCLLAAETSYGGGGGELLLRACSALKEIQQAKY